MSDFNIEERSWIVGRVYRLIAEYFAHWEDASFSKGQLDDVYREYLHEGLAASDRNEFVAVIRRWIAKLNNGHTWCYDTEFKAGSQLGFQLEHMDEGWVATGSLIDQVSEGDVVESIDGLSPEEWMEKADPFLTRRQPKARETQWQDDLPTIWNRYEATLRVRKRDDKVQEYTYRPFRLDADAPREHSSKANIYRKRQEHTEGRWIREGAVGYIRIPSFSEHHYAEEALSCVQQFSSAQTIILDMRYNGGGGTPLSLTKAMMDRPYRWWSETSPNIGHLRRRNPESSQFTILPDGSGAHCVNDYEESTECLFTGKVIVLTSRYAASAAEDIIMPFKDTGRGILVGEPTWGSTGQPVCFDYHNLHVGIGAVRAYMPDGTPFEGIGIQPDVPVWRTRDDMYKGRDPILERALELSE